LREDADLTQKQMSAILTVLSKYIVITNSVSVIYLHLY